eukprot:TRINITY_DN5713_c0_g1_i3.p1 TRINITY_DN5713_c0_g1~~TRINITY_DN5713_c0_g1_i3.p1  ORF type:complete len:1111 (+),score=481.11 TRINITY_DN5713_c0_g1_i3:113-3445(+)
MVLEGLATSILTRFLGDYVTGLGNISLAITTGTAVLENLELKREALDSFDLPVIVKKGFLGKLSLQIPWKQLKSKPCTVTIDRLFLIAGPKPASEYNAAQVDARAHEAKMRKVQAAEALRHSMLVKPSDVAAAPASDKKDSDGFAARLVTKIVDNLQLVVRDVSIRYEDDTDPVNPFVVGLTIERMAASSTDAHWQPSWIDDEPVVHKKVELDNFAIYASNQPFLKFADNVEMGQLMDRLIFKKGQRPTHQYLLNPVNGYLHLTLSKSDVPDLAVPKYVFAFAFTEIAFELDENQLRRLIELKKRIGRYQQGEKYRKHRPSVPVADNPRAWWQFAIRSVVGEIDARRRVWRGSYITERHKRKKKYIALHRKLLGQKKISPEGQSQYDELEHLLNFEDIVLYRSIAEALHRKEKLQKQQHADLTKAQAKTQAAASGSWFGGYFSRQPTSPSSAADPTAPAEPPVPAVTLTDAEWAELYDAIGYTASGAAPERTVHTPPEYVRTRVQFELESGALQLNNRFVSAAEGSVPLAKAVFSRLSVDVLMRTGTATFELGLDEMTVLDLYTRGTCYPQLLDPTLANKLRSPSPMPYAGDSDDDFRPAHETSSGHETSTHETSSGHETSAREPSAGHDAAAHGTTTRTDSDGETGGLPPKLLHVLVQQKPAGEGAGTPAPSIGGHQVEHVVHIELRPLDLVVNMPFIRRIQQFLHNMDLDTLQQLEVAAAARLNALKERTQERLRLLLLEQARLDLQINIHAPSIIVPEDCRAQQSHVLLLDLGVLSFRSVPRDPMPLVAPPSGSDEDQAEFYDEYRLEMRELKALLTRQRDHLADSSHPSSQLVPAFNISLTVQTARLSYDKLTRLIVRGGLPSARLSISTEQGQQLARILESLKPRDDDLSASGRRLGLTHSGNYVPTSPPAELEPHSDELLGMMRDTQRLAEPDSPPLDVDAVASGVSREVLAAARLFELHFELGSLELHLRHLGKELVLLKAERFAMHALQRKYDTTVSIQLNQFLVEDLAQSEHSEFRFLARSVPGRPTAAAEGFAPPEHLFGLPARDPADVDLVVIHYVATERESPFYQDLDKSISLWFNALAINGNRESLVGGTQQGEECF